MKRCQEEIQESSLFRGVYRLFVEKHTFEMTGACLLENIQCTQPYAKEALEAFSFNVWKHLRERERTNDFRCVWWKSLSIKNKRNENGKDYTQNTCVLLLMPTKESQRYPKVVCLSLESPAYFNKKTTEALAYTACKALNLPDTALECMFCERKNNNEGRIVFSPFGKGTLKRCGYADLPLSATAHNTLFPETVEALPSIPFNEKNNQSKIIHGRKQCRKVEGCAGTGKSFTLL